MCWEAAKAFFSKRWYFPPLENTCKYVQSAHKYNSPTSTPQKKTNNNIKKKKETESSCDCSDGKSFFVINGRFSHWFDMNICRTSQDSLPSCHKHKPQRPNHPSLIFSCPPPSPCCTSFCMWAGHWRTPRSSHQPNHHSSHAPCSCWPCVCFPYHLIKTLRTKTSGKSLSSSKHLWTQFSKYDNSLEVHICSIPSRNLWNLRWKRPIRSFGPSPSCQHWIVPI